ncbi:hypothetical protein ACFX1X_017666 [Malus domestica]
MWRSWSKSTVQIHDTQSPSSPFSFSSFKDIHNICADETNDHSLQTTTAAATTKENLRYFPPHPSRQLPPSRLVNLPIRPALAKPQPELDDGISTKQSESSISFIPG